MEESESNSLEESHDQERPKRRSEEIGGRSKSIEKGSCNHEVFFWDLHKGSSDKGPENQRRHSKASNKNANVYFVGSQSREVDRERRQESIKNEAESEMRKAAKREIAGKYLSNRLCLHRLLVTILILQFLTLQRISQVSYCKILEILAVLKERNREKSKACMEKHFKNAFKCGVRLCSVTAQIRDGEVWARCFHPVRFV